MCQVDGGLEDSSAGWVGDGEKARGGAQMTLRPGASWHSPSGPLSSPPFYSVFPPGEQPVAWTSGLSLTETGGISCLLPRGGGDAGPGRGEEPVMSPEGGPQGQEGADTASQLHCPLLSSPASRDTCGSLSISLLNSKSQKRNTRRRTIAAPGCFSRPRFPGLSSSRALGPQEGTEGTPCTPHPAALPGNPTPDSLFWGNDEVWELHRGGVGTSRIVHFKGANCMLCDLHCNLKMTETK